MSALDDERRSALLAAKLRAVLAREGVSDPDSGTVPGGATARSGSSGWYYAEREPQRALGPALAWARQQAVRELHVVVEQEAGVLARRASAFRDPPAVWNLHGDRLEAAEPAPLEPPSPPPDAPEVVRLLNAAGVEVRVEHAALVGEVEGLEVARVVRDGDDVKLEVGVGRHDREAFALVHGDLPPDDAVAAVVGSVRRHRHASAPHHPLKQLAPERWLRARLVAQPTLAGLAELHPRPLTTVRTSVKDRLPAGAVGRDEEGATVVVACSVGVDLDLVPVAADLRLAVEAEGRAVDRLLLVLPERDALPVTRELGGALERPAELLGAPGDWRDPSAGTVRWEPPVTLG